ncbi:thioesterase family protein [Svornostia abyssi]|uniref:Thioesterase family protein n=1 Tax=Svornostia abyssi TaxID=2898438 RepID=A0ABY5PBM0_9ACTN|nr:thioesterase family protein [Parviterribacteraceae bacterium J379]
MTEAAVFVPRDGGVAATGLARGPWNPGEAHGGAPAALLAGAIEALDGDFAVSRLAVDFLGAVPLDVPLRVETTIVKPGSRFQLVDAVLRGPDRDLMRARAVRLRRAPQETPPSPGPAAPPPRDAFADHPGLVLDPAADRPPGFFPDAMEIRVVDGAPGSGAATAWFRLRAPILPGQAPTPLQRAVAAADFANGVSFRVPFDQWLFVNCDLTVHLSRDPVGEWIGLVARTDLGDAGAGLAAGTLFDDDGRVGTVAQSLFVQRR